MTELKGHSKCAPAWADFKKAHEALLDLLSHNEKAAKLELKLEQFKMLEEVKQVREGAAWTIAETRKR